MGDPAIGWAVRLTLALLFCVSAGAKLAAREAFVAVVEGYRLLPRGALRPAAYAIMAAEAAAAAGLWLPGSAPYAAGLGVALLAAFSVAMAVNLLRGRREIDCGCFGPLLRQRLSWWLVARNAVLAALAVWVIRTGPGGAGGLAGRAPTWLDGVTAVGAAGAAATLYLAIHQLSGASRRGASG